VFGVLGTTNRGAFPMGKLISGSKLCAHKNLPDPEEYSKGSIYECDCGARFIARHTQENWDTRNMWYQVRRQPIADETAVQSQDTFW